MGAVRRIAVYGPATPAASWGRYTDLGQWSSWSPQISGVDADTGRLRSGLAGQVRTWFGLKVPFVVIAVDDAAMTWSWIATIGPIRLTLHHGITPSGTGTRATLAVEGPALVVAAYAPLAWWALRHLVR